MNRKAVVLAIAAAVLLGGCVQRYERPVTGSATMGPPQVVVPDIGSQSASLTTSGALVPLEVIRFRSSCVPYARTISGIQIRGDAWTWWNSADGLYERGRLPEVGAVIVMSRSKTMSRGHVGVVTAIINSREIQIDHANWRPGEAHRGALVRDVSAANDWSVVQVWYPPINGYGTGKHKLSGFIYPQRVDI